MNLAPADGTIYLDHAATTPIDPRVVEAMLPYLTDQFGNPSSIYRLGQDARAALDRSRDAIARVSGLPTGENSSSPAARPRAATWR